MNLKTSELIKNLLRECGMLQIRNPKLWKWMSGNGRTEDNEDPTLQTKKIVTLVLRLKTTFHRIDTLYLRHNLLRLTLGETVVRMRMLVCVGYFLWLSLKTYSKEGSLGLKQR